MRIFISYRRADSRSFTERISDYLVEQYGSDQVFQDVDNIPAGEDFRTVLRQAVDECDIVLVVIGSRWLTVDDEYGRRRIDNRSDFVRIEVESALSMNKLVIPLLVDGASMPAEDDLPAELRELAFRNAAPIRYNPDFNRDMERLVVRLNAHLARLQQAEQAQAEAARKAQQEQEAELARAEAARKAQQEQEAELARAEAARKAQEEQEAELARLKEQARLAEEARRRLEEKPKAPPGLVPQNQFVSVQPQPEPVVTAPAVSADLVERQAPKRPETLALPVPRWKRIVVQGTALLFTAVVVFPLLWILFAPPLPSTQDTPSDGSTTTPPPTIDVGGAGASSVGAGLLTALLADIVGVFTAYGWSYLPQGRLRSLLLFVFTLPQIVPPISLLIPLVLIFRSLGLLNTPMAAIVTYATLSLPFVIWIMCEYFAEPAVSDGAIQPAIPTVRDLFARLRTRSGLGALLAAAALSMLVTWQDFIAANMLGLRNNYSLTMLTVSTRLQQPSLGTAQIATLLVISIVPALLVWFVARRYLVRRWSDRIVQTS